MFTEIVIEPATTEWEAPTLLTPCKDGSLCFCVDYQKLDAVTDRDLYCLIRMHKYIDYLVGATLFSTLDVNLRY